MDTGAFTPRLDILPPPQRRLWDELGAAPEHFTLYGGTALALHLAHQVSMDFDFFSNQGFDPDRLARTVPYLAGAERVRVDTNTLTCRVERGEPVLVSFFGDLGLGQVAAREQARGSAVYVASLLDIAGRKAAVIQQRAQEKDYLDIDALLRHGIDLATTLAAGRVVYGRSFNPLITLKALSYYKDVPTLPVAIQQRLVTAVAAIDEAHLPTLVPYAERPGDGGAPS